jgi:hypothetical protein
MTDRELRSYLAGQRLMDAYQIMREVIDNGETAIIRDLTQTGDNGVKGDWYDAYVDGRLMGSFDTESEALGTIRNEINKKRS